MVANTLAYMQEMKEIKDVQEMSKYVLWCKSENPQKTLLSAFLEESKRCYYTAFKFPKKVVSQQEKQAGQQNYEYFIHTMADMMKKYAPEILN